MKYTFIVLFLSSLFFSCTNDNSDIVSKPVTDTIKPKLEVCTFNLPPQLMGTLRRATVPNDLITSRKPKPVKPITPVLQGTPVILIDFDGDVVSNTAWNYNVNGPITAMNCGMTAEAMQEVYLRAVREFSPWVVTITTDEGLYNATSISLRAKINVTTTAWYGQAGGVAYTGSFGTSNAIAWCFSQLLNFNTKYVSDAVVHEIGHMLGLPHNAKVGFGKNGVDSCYVISVYNYGENGRAPNMGVAYYSTQSYWADTAYSPYCGRTNEIAIINSKLKRKLSLTDKIKKIKK